MLLILIFGDRHKKIKKKFKNILGYTEKSEPGWVGTRFIYKNANSWEAEAGKSLSLRPAYSTRRVPDSQGYVERTYFKNKQRLEMELSW